MNEFPPIESLVAHRENMLLIERVLTVSSQSIEVLARVDASAWFANFDGSMPGWVGIELMAQAVAAWAGLESWQRGDLPKQGFLLGTRSYVCKRSNFLAGAELRVTAVEVFRETNGLAAFDCKIEHSGETVAEASLKLFEPQDFASFMEQEQV